ncbi:MAG: YihY/virulence factor BrkB family protein [Actinomycetia bacterium]|nr:YihY/virulence factor BrkB family protein [Actinomycetes bacterium]
MALRADPPPTEPTRGPVNLRRASWAYGTRLLLRQIGAHQITDMAATMTYYLVLSVFPLLLVLVSLFTLLGNADTMVPAIERTLGSVLPAEVMTYFRPFIEGFLTSQGAGLALVVGLVVALWSASNYIGAFGRAMNRVYDVAEGRSPVRRRAVQIGLTVVLAGAITLLVAALVISESVASWLSHQLGLGQRLVDVWTALRLPVIGVLGVVLLALMYYLAPNVRRPPRRLWSPGALLAVLLSVLIGWGFGIYLSALNGADNYTRTYGTLAGIVIVLFLAWLVNVMILLGAEVDAVLERVIELRSGLDARERLLLPPRDGSQARRARTARTNLGERAEQLRLAAVDSGAEPSRWYATHALAPDEPVGEAPDAEPLWRRMTGRLRRVQADEPPPAP